MTLTERAAYLKGLAEGLNLDETKPEAKLLKEIIAVIDDLTCDVTDLAEELGEIGDYCEELDEDLGALEEDFYGDECDCCDCDDDECNGDCDCCDYDEDEEFEIECPACGALFPLCEGDDPANLVCPACGERFSCECDGDCDCCE